MTSVIPTTVCAREQFVWSASTQLTSLGIRKMRPVRLRRATLIMRIRLVRLIAAVKCVWRVNCVACTSLTFLATLVSARLSVAICLFHEQLVLESLASLSQLQMSGTHCRFTFDPHTLVGQFRAGSRLIFLDGLSLTFSLSTIKEIELNWTVFMHTVIFDDVNWSRAFVVAEIVFAVVGYGKSASGEIILTTWMFTSTASCRWSKTIYTTGIDVFFATCTVKTCFSVVSLCMHIFILVFIDTILKLLNCLRYYHDHEIVNSIMLCSEA